MKCGEYFVIATFIYNSHYKCLINANILPNFTKWKLGYRKLYEQGRYIRRTDSLNASIINFYEFSLFHYIH